MVERIVPAKLLNDITECPICKASFNDPRSLPCVHTFCLNCITKWSENKLPGDRVDCPSCRREFIIPEKGVGELPKNIFTRKLLALKEMPDAPAAIAKLCDWCSAADTTIPAGKRNTAKMFCIECQESLCDNCNDIQLKSNNFSSHRIVGFEDFFETQTTCLPPTMCDRHPNNEIEVYCLRCHDASCIVCFETKHTGREAADVIEVAGELRKEISASNSELRDSIAVLEENMKRLQDKRQTIDDQFSIVEMEITERANQLKAIIERHMQQLLVEVNQMKTERLKRIDADVNENEKNICLLQSLVKYSEELLKKGSNNDIALESKSLKLSAAELKQCFLEPNEKIITMADSVVAFQPSDKLMKNSSNVVGRLMVNSVENEVILRTKGRKLRPTLRLSLRGNGSVSAVTSFNNELFVSRFGVNCIAVYDTSTCALKRDISFPDAGYNWLRGLAACSTNNCLYVSDCWEEKVFKVNLPDSSPTTEWSVGSSPVGLSVNRVHNLLVTCSDAMKIQEFTTNGFLVREISVQNLLWHAIDLKNGTLAVSQAGPLFHGVSIMSVDGIVLHSYGTNTEGSGPEQMNCARCLVVDRQGFILVADRDNDRILAIDPQRTEARTLPLPALEIPLKRPTAPCYEESRGRLYVGTCRDIGLQARVFVFDCVFSINELFIQ